jgi:hypothetical protein
MFAGLNASFFYFTRIIKYVKFKSWLKFVIKLKMSATWTADNYDFIRPVLFFYWKPDEKMIEGIPASRWSGNF